MFVMGLIRVDRDMQGEKPSKIQLRLFGGEGN